MKPVITLQFREYGTLLASLVTCNYYLEKAACFNCAIISYHMLMAIRCIVHNISFEIFEC